MKKVFFLALSLSFHLVETCKELYTRLNSIKNTTSEFAGRANIQLFFSQELQAETQTDTFWKVNPKHIVEYAYCICTTWRGESWNISNRRGRLVGPLPLSCPIYDYLYDFKTKVLHNYLLSHLYWIDHKETNLNNANAYMIHYATLERYIAYITLLDR